MLFRTNEGSRPAAHRMLVLLGVTLSAYGCNDSEEPAYRESPCKSFGVFRRTVNRDDVTLGHSAHDVARAFATNGPGLLQWFDGAETTLHISADISNSTVSIDEPLSSQGFCYRSMNIDGVLFTITTDDGRLEETLVSLLTASDRGGPILTIWANLGIDLNQLRGSLQLPDAWRGLGQHIGPLMFLVKAKTNLNNSFCSPNETPDRSPTSLCTLSDGKILIHSGNNFGNNLEKPAGIQFVGKWNWQPL